MVRTKSIELWRLKNFLLKGTDYKISEWDALCLAKRLICMGYVEEKDE